MVTHPLTPRTLGLNPEVKAYQRIRRYGVVHGSPWYRGSKPVSPLTLNQRIPGSNPGGMPGLHRLALGNGGESLSLISKRLISSTRRKHNMWGNDRGVIPGI